MSHARASYSSSESAITCRRRLGAVPSAVPSDVVEGAVAVGGGDSADSERFRCEDGGGGGELSMIGLGARRIGTDFRFGLTGRSSISSSSLDESES